MIDNQVMPCGFGTIAIYSVSKQTWVTKKFKNTKENREILARKAAAMNGK